MIWYVHFHEVKMYNKWTTKLFAGSNLGRGNSAANSRDQTAAGDNDGKVFADYYQDCEYNYIERYVSTTAMLLLIITSALSYKEWELCWALHCIALQGQIEQEVAMQVSRSRLEFDQVAMIITIIVIISWIAFSHHLSTPISLNPLLSETVWEQQKTHDSVRALPGDITTMPSCDKAVAMAVSLHMSLATAGL